MREFYEGIVNNLDSVYLSFRVLFVNRKSSNIIFYTMAVHQFWDQDIVILRVYLNEQMIEIKGFNDSNVYRFKYDNNRRLLLYKGLSCVWDNVENISEWKKLSGKIKDALFERTILLN